MQMQQMSAGRRHKAEERETDPPRLPPPPASPFHPPLYYLTGRLAVAASHSTNLAAHNYIGISKARVLGPTSKRLVVPR